MAKSQSAFIQSLFRIDPTQGFVDYVQTVKPYHTKILDVLIEYVYAEDMNVTITDRLSWVMEFRRPNVDTVYACGYGFVWDPLLSLTTPDTLLAPLTVIDATPAIAAPSPGFENSNSFLIVPNPFPQFVVATASIGNNQLVFSQNYDVLAVDLVNNEWDVDDPLNELATLLTAGSTVFVSSDTGPTGNGKYTVVSVTWFLGVATVEVSEAIPVQANGDGVFHRPLDFNELPAWPAGQAITMSITGGGTLPTPLVAGTRYFFQPTPVPGYFNLATKRYPLKFDDFVDLTNLGTGTFEIQRDESVVPGAQISVKSTSFHRDDGTFIVKDVVAEGANERIFVYQKLEGSTGGVMTFANLGYDDPLYCNVAQAGDLHLDTFIHESLKFTFEIDLADYIESSFEENDQKGFGDEAYGGGLFGPYGTYADQFYTRVAVTSGNQPNGDNAHTILPTGIDTQLFDVGGLDESYHTVKLFYGESV